jgi:hypothetical protein
MQAPSEEKSDDSKGSYYGELEHVFEPIPKYHMRIQLGYYNARVGRQIIFKLTIRDESLHQNSNDNGVRIRNIAI